MSISHADTLVIAIVTEFPARIKSLPHVYTILHDFWQQVTSLHTPAPTEMLYHTLTTAAMEIASNIVRHAYGDSADCGLRMGLRLFPHRIEISFHDDGIEFEQTSIDTGIDPNQTEFPSTGGLGLFLVRRSVDEMHYAREDGENRWLLVKRLA